MLLPTTPAWRIEPGTALNLAELDPEHTGPYPNREAAALRMAELRRALAQLQERLYAEHQRSLLLVFQAMDTGGKDGAIGNLLTGVNPAGVQVTSFKKPSEEALNHDFLWRIHLHAPGRGHIGVWNRSHYEDVLITRVHKMVDEPTWRGRYAHLNNFEQLLTDNGTRILKFFLHISKDEQGRRLQARLDEPAKRWKFNPGDLVERRLWDEYQQAYTDALTNCSTADAPWYVIPANHKWARDLALLEIVVATLREMNPQPPAITFEPGTQVIE